MRRNRASSADAWRDRFVRHHLLIDAVIDVPWARKRYPDKPDDFFIQPAAIADELWHVAQQPRSAWSFLTEVRPFKESW